MVPVVDGAAGVQRAEGSERGAPVEDTEPRDDSRRRKVGGHRAADLGVHLLEQNVHQVEPFNTILFCC